jgi:hypothetical protein
MPELEHALRQLGGRVEFPPTPDLSSRVRRRLEEEPRRRWRPSRRALAIALAVLAVAVGAVMAVPSARTAVLDWLGIKGVDIVRVEKLPEVAPPADLGLGERVTLVEARRRVSYKVVVPEVKGLGEADAVYVDRHRGGDQISFLWGTPERVRLLVSEFPGMSFAQKMLGPGTKAERVDVNGEPGVWIEGAPHAFVYRVGNHIFEETLRLVNNALVWQHGELTLRLEGELTKKQALEIARSAR